MKRKNPTIQGSYGEIFQPDSDIQLRVLALFGMFIAMALILSLIHISEPTRP